MEGMKVAGIACGTNHTVVCTAGAVYTFGYGSWGCLGHGGEGNEYLPRIVQGLEGRKVVFAAAAGHLTIIRTDQDEIFTFGYGGNWCLGHGVCTKELVPRMVDFTPQTADNKRILKMMVLQALRPPAEGEGAVQCRLSEAPGPLSTAAARRVRPKITAKARGPGGYRGGMFC